MNWKYALAAIPLAVGLSLGAGNALAAACKFNTTNPATVAGSPGDVDTTDMTLEGTSPPVDNSADDCAALYDGNDSATEINSIASQLGWGDDYVLGAKSDEGPGEDEGLVFGINWQVEVDTATGDWLLTFTDAGTSATLDLIAVLKQGDFYAVFFFDDVEFNTNGESEGTYLVDWCTSKAPGTDRFACSGTGLSHLSVFLGEGGDDITRNPEPASLLLLGIGLAGLALTQRRRRRV